MPITIMAAKMLKIGFRELLNTGTPCTKVCELGNQEICEELPMPFNSAKKWFESMGIEHVSIDLNGLLGAVSLDLSKPIDRWPQYFDMTTNLGTAEHVLDQYEVYKNIHNFTRIGGIMINGVPLYPTWPKHAPYQYGLGFFGELAKANNYNIVVLKKGIALRAIREYCLAWSVLEKTRSEFISREQFLSLPELYYNKRGKKYKF